jgi:hypothetical protein
MVCGLTAHTILSVTDSRSPFPDLVVCRLSWSIGFEKCSHCEAPAVDLASIPPEPQGSTTGYNREYQLSVCVAVLVVEWDMSTGI